MLRVFTILGYDAAMYDGSFQEWSSKNLPVVKGEARQSR
jgi:3-mercaptopyruvate sulfurtransferase SseA